MRKILHLAKKWSADYAVYLKDVKYTGLTFEEYLTFHYSKNDGINTVKNSVLFGKTIERTNTFWYTQCVLEMFNDQVYRFNSDNPQPKIIDCGTNIGLSLIYFKRLYPNCSIIGFEADPFLYKICKRNLEQFSYADIELMNAAVWNEDTSLSFMSDNSLGGHLSDKPDPNAKQITVPAMRLKKFLDTPVDFLKVDIEGAEYQVLMDCAEQLKNVKNLFFEYHSSYDQPQQLHELLSLVKQSGFRIYIKEAWNTMTHPFIEHPDKNFGFDLQLNVFAYRK